MVVSFIVLRDLDITKSYLRLEQYISLLDRWFATNVNSHIRLSMKLKTWVLMV